MDRCFWVIPLFLNLNLYGNNYHLLLEVRIDKTFQKTSKNLCSQKRHLKLKHPAANEMYFNKEKNGYLNPINKLK